MSVLNVVKHKIQLQVFHSLVAINMAYLTSWKWWL